MWCINHPSRSKEEKYRSHSEPRRASPCAQNQSGILLSISDVCLTGVLRISAPAAGMDEDAQENNLYCFFILANG